MSVRHGTVKWIKKDLSTGKAVVLLNDGNGMFAADTPALPRGTRVSVCSEEGSLPRIEVLEGEDRHALEASRFYHKTKGFLSPLAIETFCSTCANPDEAYSANPFCLLNAPDPTQPLRFVQLCTLKDVMSNASLGTKTEFYEMTEVMKAVLRSNESRGNTFMEKEVLLEEVGKRYERAGRKVSNLKACFESTLMVSASEFYYSESAFGAPVVALKDTYEFEFSLAKAVFSSKAAQRRPAFSEVPGDPNMSDEQNAASKGALSVSDAICVVTGGPGTGKSTLIASVVRRCAQFDPKARIAVLAPTGKASKRNAELLNREGIGASAQVTVQTVHRFVGYGMYNRGPAYKNAAEHDLIIIDEASMLTMEVFEDLATLLDFSKTRVLLIGDENQLPSVDTGSLFSDVMDMGVPVFKLNENHRSTSAISRNAALILAGSADFVENDEFEIRNMGITQSLREVLKRFKNQPPCAGPPAKPKDFAVLTPFSNAASAASTKAVNAIMQGALLRTTSQLKPVPYSRFCIGDEVIMTQNNPRSGFVNGSTGTVSGFDKDALAFRVLLEDAEVLVPLENTMGSRSCMELGYATTVHKAEGSEYDEVLVLLPEYTPFFTKSLLYTAVTRAKKRVVIFGSPDTLAAIVGNASERDHSCRTLSKKVLEGLVKKQRLAK